MTDIQRMQAAARNLQAACHFMASAIREFNNAGLPGCGVSPQAFSAFCHDELPSENKMDEAIAEAKRTART